ncbi:hypothetical protein PYCCODRAFT_1371056 [Trametes coccinea BRFM310]|uniref:Hydrophobic surface binding protein n=1 Tax=Trametes coccinea (strain BRFM310) TaxID=1353009 RepID=A0A1Y2IH75_TRAC3|nr:hypothetical protein PYCCODRAFT_1371056 [Trametes coccinea BRFM310]
MVRILALAFVFSSFLAGAQVFGAPAREIVARQIGDLQCNVDRLSIVAGLATTQGTLKKLSQDLAHDPTSAASVQSAADSISGAQGAIGVIAKALLTGQTAPAEARNQVLGNLTAAHDTLAAINSTDSTASATLQKALSELNDSAEAGNGVVNNCK